MKAPGWFDRLRSWLAGLVWGEPVNECGILGPEGDVYCALPDGHDGLHGFEVTP